MAWHYPLIEDLVDGRWPGLADHTAVDRAVGAAWTTAEGAGKAKLIGLLLHRRQTAGLATLIRHYHELDRPTKDGLASQLGGLHGVLRRMLPTTGPDSAMAVRGGLELIADGIVWARSRPRDSDGPSPSTDKDDPGRAGLLDMVAQTLRHPDPGVRERAGQVYLSLCDPMTADGPEARQASLSPRSARRVVEAVGEAVQRYAVHRHPAVLEAWLGLGRRVLTTAGPTAAALHDPEHPAIGGLRELLQHAGKESDAARQERIIRGLLPALMWPTLAMAAVQGLRSTREAGRLGSALAGGEALLDLPAIRKTLARAGEPTDLLPESLAQSMAAPDSDSFPVNFSEPLPQELETLGLAEPAWAAWVEALPMGDLAKAVRWGRLARGGGPELRLAALRRLAPFLHPSGECDPRVLAEARAAAKHCAITDPDPAIARLAATHLLTGAPSAEAAAGLVGSRHPEVRAQASRALGRQAFARVWKAWPKLDHVSRERAARAALRMDPAARPQLDAALQGPEPERRRARTIAAWLEPSVAPPPAGPGRPAVAVLHGAVA